jgi:hypothetical protein
VADYRQAWRFYLLLLAAVLATILAIAFVWHSAAASPIESGEIQVTNGDTIRGPCTYRPGTEGTRACNYGRLCQALRAAGRDVGSILVAEGLARPYVCGRNSYPRRESWCGAT